MEVAFRNHQRHGTYDARQGPNLVVLTKVDSLDICVQKTWDNSNNIEPLMQRILLQSCKNRLLDPRIFQSNRDNGQTQLHIFNAWLYFEIRT